jgi:hypothetical protein
MRTPLKLVAVFTSLLGCLLAIPVEAQSSLMAGLVAYFPFNGNAQDQSGYSNAPIFLGATLTADHSGKANSAYSFNGIADQITPRGERV